MDPGTQTPRKINKGDVLKVAELKSMENAMTPRRSARKSIRPAQDYEEIVLKKRTLRSCNFELENTPIEEHKWTPSKVGRFSNKRSVRKGRSGKKSEGKISSDEVVHSSEDSGENRKNYVNVCSEAMKDITHDVLNATFDKGEDVSDQIVVENIEDERNVVLNKESEIRYVIASIDSTELENGDMCLPSLKPIVEENDLGCTPILYDENSEHGRGKEVGNEIKYESSPILLNETFEKLPEDLETIGEKEKSLVGEHGEVFIEEETKVEKTKNQVQKIIEKSNADVVYTPIDLLSDDELPSLMLSDDEADNNTNKGPLNNTFSASDCTIIDSAKIDPGNEISLSERKRGGRKNLKVNLLAQAQKRVKELQENYFSPIKRSTKETLPTIVLNDTKNVTTVLAAKSPSIKSRKNVDISVSLGKRQIDETPVSMKKSKVTVTPVSTKKRESKGYRFPTPYKPKKNFLFGDKNHVDKENVFKCETEHQDRPITLTTLEPKDFVLRSIRKRSMSADGDQRKRPGLNVTFYSPANQTANISDLDKMLAKSAAKVDISQQRNVTRRKRSISMDENYLPTHASKLPRLVHTKTQKPKATTYTRLPNFAAIHQQQFEKMENVVDYVARKAERAQNLSNSALKPIRSAAKFPASKQKSAASKSSILTPSSKGNENKSLIKKSSSEDSNKDVTHKLQTRTQRHIDLFKSCLVDSKRSTKKNADIIRGVRSNRRFELMMQHRKNTGNY